MTFTSAARFNLDMKCKDSLALRIAVLTERFPGGGGGISTAHEGIGQLLASKHEICFFAFQPSVQPSERNVERTTGNRLLGGLLGKCLEWKVRRHAPDGQITAVNGIARSLVGVRRLNSRLARFRPDFIIVSDYELPLLGMAIPNGAKVIWVAHHNYLRFANNPFLSVSCPYDLFLAHRLERRAVRRSDYAVFPSVWMEGVFRTSLSSTLPGRVIPNLLPTMPALPGRHALRRTLNIGENDLGIFLPSGGTEIKGARFVPEIIRRVSSAVASCFFVISGPVYGMLANELEFLQTKSRIIVEGAVPRDRALALASICDLCISPALLENYSCALLECQTLGLPVIATRVGGNAEIVSEGVTGWLADVPDIDRIVFKACDLLVDTEKRQQMSLAATRRAVGLADPQEVFAKWQAVFEEFMTSTRNPRDAR